MFACLPFTVRLQIVWQKVCLVGGARGGPGKGKEGWPMRGLESGHVTCGPMRGLKINFTGRGQHTDIRTSRLSDWIGPVGRFSENTLCGFECVLAYIRWKISFFSPGGLILNFWMSFDLRMKTTKLWQQISFSKTLFYFNKKLWV